MRAFLCFVFAGLPALLLAQPDCRALGFGDVLPTAGTNLRRCVDAAEQCCSPDYLTSVENKVLRNLQAFLVEEFEDIIEDYVDDVDNLIDYFSEEFIDSMVDALPGANFINQSDAALRAVVRDLADNFDIPESDDDDDEDSNGDDNDGDDHNDDNDNDGGRKRRVIDFDTEQFVQSLIDALGDAVVRALSDGNSDTVECVRRVADSVVNRAAIVETARLIQEIRMAITTLRRIGAFLETQRRALAEATFLDECIATFIDLAFCSRCIERTPPLCFNTCNALLRACYSPYYTALNRQYSQLWTITQRVVVAANDTVRTLLSGEEALIDTATFTRLVASECSVRVPDGDSSDEADQRRDTDSDEDSPSGDDRSSNEDTTGDSDSSRDARGDGRSIPFGLVDDLFELTGAFAYSRYGLELCRDTLEDGDTCPAVGNDQRYCNGTDICTSKCRCTDGEVTRETDTTEVFMLNDIADQRNNPVLRIDQDVLLAQANMLSQEDPVNDFLTSSAFQSVVPDGVEQTDDSSGVMLVTSVTIILLGLLMAFV